MSGHGLELAFVLAPGQNHFFIEFVDAVRFELAQLGVASSVHSGRYPPALPGRVFVLAPPHEYFRLYGASWPPGHRLLRRTIYISLEQPGSSFFNENVKLASYAGAVFDISATAVREYGRRGVRAHRFPLGYSRFWEPSIVDSARDLDVLFMGCESPKRASHLAAYGGELAMRRFRILLSDNSGPNTNAASNFLVGEEKKALLSRSKILLNVHQSTERYFEWLRVVEAVHARCMVLTEPSIDHAPLEAGVHFLQAPVKELASVAKELLADDDRRQQITAAAYEFLREQLPLVRSAERLANEAETVDRLWPAGVANGKSSRREQRRSRPVAGGLWEGLSSTSDHRLAVLPGRRGVRTGLGPGASVSRFVRDAFRHYSRESRIGLDTSIERTRREMKELGLDVIELRREIAHIRPARTAPLAAEAETLVATPAFHGVAPRVSVITPLYNQGDYCIEAIESVCSGTYRDWEHLVVDDGSIDGSAATVHAWAGRNPSVPLALLRQPFNRGLPRTRNIGIAAARGEYIFMLDADNSVLPRALETLVEALDNSRDAAFAYGMLACIGPKGYRTLVSQFPWSPGRLRHRNYIDAMALFRTDVVRAEGGYTDDRRLYGWEDYDLYCRLAEHGYFGEFVPEIVARYRLSSGSMISLTNLSHKQAYEALEEHCPTLMFSAPGRIEPRL
jgi:hypothetical protein